MTRGRPRHVVYSPRSTVTSMSVSLAPRTHTGHARTMGEPADTLQMLVRRYAEIVDTRVRRVRRSSPRRPNSRPETGDGSVSTRSAPRCRASIATRPPITGLVRRRSPSTANGPPVPSSGGAPLVDERQRHRTDRVMTITYYDRYEQTPAGWRLTHRRLDIHRIDEVDVDGLRTP